MKRIGLLEAALEKGPTTKIKTLRAYGKGQGKMGGLETGNEFSDIMV